MEEIEYGGYFIKPSVFQVSKGHEHEAEWIAGEYSIIKEHGDSIQEQQFYHESKFYPTEIEAKNTTIRLAKETIDKELVGF